MPMSDVIRYEHVFCSVGLYIGSAFCISSGVGWVFFCFLFFNFFATLLVHVSTPRGALEQSLRWWTEFFMHIGFFSCLLAYPCLIRLSWIPFLLHFSL
jgi:hypothetical protein